MLGFDQQRVPRKLRAGSQRGSLRLRRGCADRHSDLRCRAPTSASPTPRRGVAPLHECLTGTSDSGGADKACDSTTTGRLRVSPFTSRYNDSDVAPPAVRGLSALRILERDDARFISGVSPLGTASSRSFLGERTRKVARPGEIVGIPPRTISFRQARRTWRACPEIGRKGRGR
jgi:hypothetical protein